MLTEYYVCMCQVEPSIKSLLDEAFLCWLMLVCISKIYLFWILDNFL